MLVALQLQLLPLQLMLLYPVEHVPLYVHVLVPLTVPEQLDTPVPFVHVAHVFTIHNPVTLLLLQLGVSYDAAFAIPQSVVQLVLPVPLFFLAAVHNSQLVLPVLALYDPVGHAVQLVAVDDAAYCPAGHP